MDKRVRRNMTFQILGSLALNGPQNKWQLSKGLKGAYSHIHKEVQCLLDGGAICAIDKKRAERTIHMIDYYDITLLGILRLLTTQYYLNQIEAIAMQNASKLPLIFGKWEFFKKEKIDKPITTMMEEYLIVLSWQLKKLLEDKTARQEGKEKDMVMLRTLYGDQAERKYSEIQEQNDKLLDCSFKIQTSQDIIYRHIFFGPPYGKDEGGRRLRSSFMPIWMKDPELKAYLTVKLVELEQDYTKILQDIQKWKRIRK
jgi:hypothetical protein